MQLIPAIDLKDGRCVRLLEGRFEDKTEYSADPVALASDYARAGAEWVHLVDLDGARDGHRSNSEIIARMTAACGTHVQIGGGIRDEADVREVLALGADRVVVGSTAVEAFDTTSGWLSTFGPERVVVALDIRIDANGDPRPRTRGWVRTSRLTLWTLLSAYTQAGLKHLLCTDIARDGTLAGPNTGLYQEICRRYPTLAVQASGGVSNVDDLRQLAAAGADGAISGKALLDGRIKLEEVTSFLPNA